MAKEQAAIFGMVLVLAAVFLLRDPNCNRGCRTVAEHLLSHGLEDLVSELIG